MKVKNKVKTTINNLTMRGRIMKKYIIFLGLAIMTGGLFADGDGAGRCNPDVPGGDWCYEGSTLQAFAQLEFVTVDGEIAPGDGSGELDESEECYGTGACDVIGAFIDRGDGAGEICVGWQYAAPEFTTVGLNGNDGLVNFNGMQSGEIPYFKIWDASNNSILDISLSEEIEGWANFAFFTLYGTSTADNTFGCSDANACNYDESVTADDGSCASNDCAGECGGSAVEDECGACDSDSSNDCVQDCLGDWGGTAELDCLGNCDGDAVLDGCGVCDGDNSSCTGCTNSDADNYDASSIFGDDSCTFTVNGATNFAAEAGPARVFLSWNAPEDNFTESSAGYTYDIVDSDGNVVKSTSQTSTQVTDLAGGVESCFTLETRHNAYGASNDSSGPACATPEDVVGPTWRLQLSAQIDSYDQFANTNNSDWLIYDRFNYLGVASDASWGYDPIHDIPEPQSPPGPYVSLYFDHPEWDSGFTTHFTEDLVLDNDDFFSTNLTQWDGTIESNVPGAASITFSVDENPLMTPVPANYEMYVVLHDSNADQDGEGNGGSESSNSTYYRISHTEETVISFYMGGSGSQNFSVFIGNIVPQEPANLTAAGNYSSVSLNWDEDGSDLNDIRNRYPTLKYNVYRDDVPNDINGNDSTSLTAYAPGQGVDFESGQYGAEGSCEGTLLTGALGQDGSDYLDDADLYADYPGEGLLQESTYTYTVTGSNKAGESSYGHTVRMSGGAEEYFPGRFSQKTAKTGDNADPEVDLAYVASPTTVSGQLAPTNILNESGELQGLYEIPHNFSPDANRIEISIDGRDSDDEDYPYGINRYAWTQVSGNNDLEDVVGTDTDYLTFSAANLHENGDKDYTWNLHVETDHPVHDLDNYSCGEWVSRLDTHIDDKTIDITVLEEPNEDPEASSALGLIRGADGLSVLTQNNYDDSDFNDYDGLDQAWYEPHDGSGDQNNADLWFSASNSDDADNECESEDQEDCDHQTYSWTLTQGALAGFSYDDLNGNGSYEFGEPFTLVGGDEIYADADLGDHVSGGPAAEDLSTVLDLPRDVYTHDHPSDSSGSFGYNGLSGTDLNGGGRDLHLSLGSSDSASGSESQEVYILSMTVTDVYGDSDAVSVLVLVRDERNAAPTVGAHREQATYYMRHDEDTRDVYIDGCDNLSAFDTDNDSQDFSWSYSGPGAFVGGSTDDQSALNLDGFASSYVHDYAEGDGDNTSGWSNMVAWLVEGEHTFTFTTVDGYGATNSASTTFTILDEPGAAQPSINIDHTGLKYSVISVNANPLNDFPDDLCHGDTYSGSYPDYNTSRLALYNGDEKIAEWNDNLDGTLTYTYNDRENCQDVSSDTTDESDVATDVVTHIDKSLSAETVFNYSVRAWNSELDNQSDAVLSNSASTRTHDRPDVVVTTPNGAEIRSVGDNYDVDFITYFDSNDNGLYDDGDELTDGQYIAQIDVYYLADGITEEKGDASCGLAGPDYAGCEGEDQSSFNGSNSNGCSNPSGGDSTNDDAADATDCHKGDNTLNYEIADNDGLEINYDAKVRIRVTDVGDYDGCVQQTHEDDSDNPFTMAAHTIHNSYSTGWHLVGPPVTPWNIDLKDNFSESLNQWGEDWVAYDVNGAYDTLKLNLGEGYYLALANGTTLTQHGDPVIADPDCNDCDDTSFGLADLTLKQGWNLIANPLVNKVDKATLTINDGSGDLLFEDAVDAGWIAPTIYGWFENHYEGFDRLMPFDGYWINTSRQLTIKVRPHLFEDGELTRKAEEVATSILELKARDISGNGNGDVITLGLLDAAADEFVYGEDEVDLPRQAYSAMGGEYIDMKVSSNLMKDIKSAEYDGFQVWNVSIATEKVDNDIELAWGDVSGFDDDLHLVINGEAVDMHETVSVSIDSGIEDVSIVVGSIDSYMNPVPTEFGLSSAYPNPFNPTTILGLALNEDSMVSMSVFNVRGQVVEQLISGDMKAGYHNVIWNADALSSGMYFVRVEAGSNTAMQKLMLVK